MTIEQPCPWPAELIFKPGVHFFLLPFFRADPLPQEPEFAHLSNPPSVGH